MEMGIQASPLDSVHLSMLTFIRGTTPLMMFLAVVQLNSASLVVACKCFLTCLLLGLTLLKNHWSSDNISKGQIRKNFQSKSTYWKCFILGCAQSAIPFVLVVYSLKYLPITLLAVFMATIPWLIVALQHLPFFKNHVSFTRGKFIGMVVGLVGIALVTTVVFSEAVASCATSISNHTGLVNASNESTDFSSSRDAHDGRHGVCLSFNEVFLGLISIMVALIFWAGSTLFWRDYKGDIHYLVSGLWKNLFGSIFATVVWAVAGRNLLGESNWESFKGILGLAFLGIFSGWLAALLVYRLNRSVGPVSINRFMIAVPMIAFIEDCIFAGDVVTASGWVVVLILLGVVLVSVATFLIDREDSRQRFGTGGLSERLLGEQEESTPVHFHDRILQEEIDRLEDSDYATAGSSNPSHETYQSTVVEDDDTEEEISVNTRLPPLKQISRDELPPSPP